MFAIIVTLLLTGSGIAAFLMGKRGKPASRIGSSGAVAALLCVLGVWLWRLSQGELSPNSSWYQLPVIFVGIAAALYAPGYLAHHDGGRTGFFWIFFNLTVGAMLAVTAAQNPYRFLVAWESMGLASFFLVGFDLKSRQVMRAAWIYLLGCEAGGMALMLAFSLGHLMTPAWYFIVLATGFGLKAGFPLLHVWLPEAHPAAPAPVSALMSGAMIPLGFCGLMRFMPQFPTTLTGIGWTLLVLGMIGAFSGILFAFGQRDVKRLLAYSSVENIGIMAMGFGIGLLGAGYRMPEMTFCGFIGALLHILNHALLKGTLFLGAGTILCSTHTLNMDELGGLMKKLPKTGGIFTVAALGICGLPPFCAFTSELLIYAGAFYGIAHASGVLFGALVTAAVVLALTGGCACAAFAKVISAVFQGEPRSQHALEAEPETPAMVRPLWILLLPALVIPLLPLLVPADAEPWKYMQIGILRGNAIATLVLYVLSGLLIGWRRHFGRDLCRRPGTWDCGYAKPSARMEYTGTAFVQPLADFFNALLHQKKHLHKPEGLFPKSARIEVETPDYGERGVWRPLFDLFGMAAEKIHRFQSGYLHLYILFMVIALVLMLLWGYFSGIEVK